MSLNNDFMILQANCFMLYFYKEVDKRHEVKLISKEEYITMAKYRQLYTEFWSDSFVLELTPEEKYFYLYLISNSKTTQCGIYEISKRIIETETGYNRETVEKLIKRFCDYKKILYCEETKELMVINWIKYNVPNNINAIKCVHRELNKVKHKEFLKILFKKCQVAQLDIEKLFEDLIVGEVSAEKVDKLSTSITLENSCEGTFTESQKLRSEVSDASIEKEYSQESSEFQTNEIHSGSLQGAYEGLPSNRIRSNKKEVTNKKQEIRRKEEEETKALAGHKNNISVDYEGLNDIVRIFEENLHAISPLEYEKLLDFSKYVSYEVIALAIEEAVNYNAKTMKYISQVLSSWISSGIKTATEVKTYQKQWANKKSNDVTHNAKKSGFCDYEQRSYDFDALERQLLGLTDTED